jgi:ketosteroid isomerase-like protein
VTVDRAAVERWVVAYERAWRTAGTDMLTQLFTEDATYLTSPWADASAGLDALARLWDREREGPDEVFTMASEVVAVEADTAVVRLEVAYGEPVTQRWRDLWVLSFAPDGRCAAFEEWPFAPPR